MIIIGNGAFKISADEFKKEVESADQDIRAFLEEYSRRNLKGSGGRIRIRQKKPD